MQIKIKLLAIVISVVIFFFVIELIRRKKLTFKYAVSWLAASLVGLIVAIFDNMLFTIARSIGFALPSNFIFFLVSIILILLSLILTVYLCQQTNRIELIAQKVAIIEEELSRLKQGAAKHS